jgi:hypothetical protein
VTAVAVQRRCVRVCTGLRCGVMQEKKLVARLEHSTQREVFETFMKRRQELVAEEERLGKVRRRVCVGGVPRCALVTLAADVAADAGGARGCAASNQRKAREPAAVVFAGRPGEGAG